MQSTVSDSGPKANPNSQKSKPDVSTNEGSDLPKWGEVVSSSTPNAKSKVKQSVASQNRR